MPSVHYIVDRCPTFRRPDGVDHKLVPRPHCSRCYRPIHPKYIPSGLCYDCAFGSPYSEGHLDGLIAATLYTPSTEIRTWNYGHNEEFFELKNRGLHASDYAEVLAYEMGEQGIAVDDRTLVCPIPMKMSGNGAIGAKTLSTALASRLGLEWDESLRFIRDPDKQKSAGGLHERCRNVFLSMFYVRPLEGRQVILVDDLAATGCTLGEGARALKVAGARQVIGAVAARDGKFWDMEKAGVIVIE